MPCSRRPSVDSITSALNCPSAAFPFLPLTKVKIARHSMFYSRRLSQHSPHRLFCGVPKEHILNSNGLLDKEIAFTILPDLAQLDLLDSQLSHLCVIVKTWRRLHKNCDYFGAIKRFCPVDGDLSSCLSQHSPYHSVYSYIRWIIQKSIPRNLLGCAENLEHLLTCTSKFISLKRFETVVVEELSIGFKTSSCKWLNLICKNDVRLRIHIVNQLMFWLFNDFILPILKNSFYVTETQHHRQRIFYFRHDLWNKSTKAAAQKLRESTFEKVGQSELISLLQKRDFGCFRTRFLPKEHGLRAIINLNTKYAYPRVRSAGNRKKSENVRLKNPFSILSHLASSRKNIMGSAVLGIAGIHSRIKAFKLEYEKHCSITKTTPKLYFAK
eukprot:Partr_v1_DN28560_c0_g1_i7_m73019 putative Telomerase, reverse transcriptase